jgi:hypothetical protein
MNMIFQHPSGTAAFVCLDKQGLFKQMTQAVMLQTCIQQVIGLNLGLDTCHPNSDFLWFLIIPLDQSQGKPEIMS